MDLISSQRNKIPHAPQCGQNFFLKSALQYTVGEDKYRFHLSEVPRLGEIHKVKKYIGRCQGPGWGVVGRGNGDLVFKGDRVSA